MKAGLYFFYIRLKEKGIIHKRVTWEQFYRSKAWYPDRHLTVRQINRRNKIFVITTS